MVPTLKLIARWISDHTNKVTEFVRQMMYTLILFHTLNWSPDQQMAALMALSAFLAMFTERGTVSKGRERRTGNGS